jgi:hypothetical protein
MKYRITTITAVASLSAARGIHLPALFWRADLRRAGATRATFRGMERWTEHDVFFRGKSNARAFANQVSITFPHEGSAGAVSVKVFGNGRVQMTGARTMDEARRVIEALAAQAPGADGWDDLRPCMLNAYASLGAHVDRAALAAAARASFERVAYEPCAYPAVKLRGYGAVVMVFRTGTVMITGATRMSQIDAAAQALEGVVGGAPHLFLAH